MADKFTFELVSPENLLLSGDAEMVTVPGVEGDMGILVNHAPVMTSLRPGLVAAKMDGGEEQTFFVRGGFADITPESVTVLAEFAIAQTEMTPELFEDQKRHATEAIEMADSEEAKANAHSILDQLNHLEPVVMPA